MNYASMINHKSEIINHKSIGSTSSQRRHYDGKGRFVCISWRVCTYGNRKVPDWEQRALFVNGNIVYNGRLFKEIFFEPASPSSSFELKAVTIGRNFHWQRQEDQCFKGAFNLVTGENGIVVINQVDVEEYLTSVISSEMSAQASKELLKHMPSFHAAGCSHRSKRTSAWEGKRRSSKTVTEITSN